MDTTIPPAVVEKIKGFWVAILQQYFRRCVEISQKEGPGISIFRMMRKPSDKNTNTEYYYAEKDGKVWEFLISHSPDKEPITRLYDHTKHVIIAVAIPMHENIEKDSGNDPEETCQNIRIFDRVTGKEVVMYPPPQQP